MRVEEVPVFFCTGARNHDLLNYFSKERVHFEIDERIASFKALGHAKFNGSPAIVCTTSGTAVAECVPAMVEAYYSQIPLILISGDRPGHMQGTGAPQTIRHQDLTQGHRGSYLEVPLNEFSLLDLANLSYPAHINVTIRSSQELPPSVGTQYAQGLKDFSQFCLNLKRPLILLSHEVQSLRPVAERLKKLGIPFYAESLSGARELSSLRYEKTLNQLVRNGTFDGVIRIGHTPLSKAWRMLEAYHLPVFSFDSRGLSALSHGMVLKMSAQELLEENSFWSALGPFTFSVPESPHELLTLLTKFPTSEPALLHQLQEKIPNDSEVYIGNSLVIRYFELVQTKRFRVFGNRGVNGIDGQLSTAIGVAKASGRPLTCILGDLTTLYDLTAIKDLPKNLKLVILNNSGGRIFEALKLDQRIWLEHKENFEKIVRALGKTYSQRLSDFDDAQVIELIADPKHTEAFRREWEG